MNVQAIIHARRRQFWIQHAYGDALRECIAPLTNDYCHKSSRQGFREAILLFFKSIEIDSDRNLGLGYMIPSFLLKVEQDQITFDLLRWYILFVNDDEEARRRVFCFWKCDRSEDVFKDHDMVSVPLTQLSAYALIKVSLYLHLVNIDSMYALVSAVNHCSNSPSCPLVKLEGKMDILRMILC